MRRPTPLAPAAPLALAFLAVAACGVVNRGGGSGGSRIETVRRVPVTLVLERTSVASTDETLPFTIRLTNPEGDSARVDFTGEPLFPRGPGERTPEPALWFTIERRDRASAEGSVVREFTTRDTVLGPRAVMEVPVQHSLREVGMSPGSYRMRAGIGAHVSKWVTFTVTR
jgi:hypothetical protein